VLRAVSVGFLPTKFEDRLDKKGRWLGYRYVQSKRSSSASSACRQSRCRAARPLLDLPPQLMRTFFADRRRCIAQRFCVRAARSLAHEKRLISGLYRL
jgi:hypothetical protein